MDEVELSGVHRPWSSEAGSVRSWPVATSEGDSSSVFQTLLSLPLHKPNVFFCLLSTWQTGVLPGWLHLAGTGSV